MALTNSQLASLTYGQAEDYMNAGYITRDQWWGFQTAWRRSAPHMSSLAAGLDQEQPPEIEAIAAEIKAAHEAERAAPRTPASFGFPTNL